MIVSNFFLLLRNAQLKKESSVHKNVLIFDLKRLQIQI